MATRSVPRDNIRTIATTARDLSLRSVLTCLVTAGGDTRTAAAERFRVPAAELAVAEELLAASIETSVIDPESVGAVYELLRDPQEQRSTGSYYTPAHVVSGILDLCLDGDAAPSVCDPAVGGGVFLVGAARRLAAAGVSAPEIAADHLWGADLDPLAVEVSRAVIALWAWQEHGVRVEASHIVEADTLMALRNAWPDAADGFDVVVGNPPFLGQLRRATAREQRDIKALRETLGGAVDPYSDAAALFLLASCRLAAPGGRVALILPESTLAARDAAGVRREVLAAGALRHFWLPDEPVFDAGVRVCVPVIEVGVEHPQERQATVSRSVGLAFDPVPSLDEERVRAGPTWSPLLADLRGVPPVELDSEHELGDWCTATAGFRDQFYGLAPFVVEQQEAGGDERAFPLLVTSGLIDPAVCHWGSRPCRFSKRRWDHPRVDLDALEHGDPKLYRWACDLLVPKVVLAAQTKVLEVAVDEDGAWYPSTPTIAVVPVGDRLWEVAAVLAAPAISAWAFTRYGGAALSRDAVKLSAKQVLEVPVPRDREALREGATRFREAASAGRRAERVDRLVAFGRVMDRAYGVPDASSWWSARLGY